MTRGTGVEKPETGNGKRVAVALRVLVGAVLLATGVGKLLDVPGFARVLAPYEVFPDALLVPVAAAVTAAEILLAFWLLSGRRPFAAAVAALAMHLVYAGWSAAGVLRGLKLPNCGCFGVFWPRPLGWSTVFEDVVVASLCVVLASVSRRSRPERPASPVPA